ncbi:hypothetical protein ON010_g13002 [Phytophthora cinnamomi]|nr:hypothetical protein ON010_g13002 [Phytophthora cinnamomi]
MTELCAAIDGAFTEAVDDSDLSDDEICLEPALLAREQRSLAARLYNSVVTWSLWYAHSVAMSEEGWVVEIEKCTKRLGRPGVEDKPEKLFNRQVRKTKLEKRKNTVQNTGSIVSTDTELVLEGPSTG